MIDLMTSEDIELYIENLIQIAKSVGTRSGCIKLAIEAIRTFPNIDRARLFNILGREIARTIDILNLMIDSDKYRDRQADLGLVQDYTVKELQHVLSAYKSWWGRND